MKLLLTFLWCSLSFLLVSSRGLREEFTWTRINYQWPTRSTRQVYHHKSPYLSTNPVKDKINFPGTTNVNDQPSSTTPAGPTDGSYVYENNIPMGANRWKNKIFITVPRRRLGVPSTLNYIWANGTGRHNVPLIPYPDWSTNTIRQNKQIEFVSVYRVAVDSCDRLWFVDTGVIEIPGHPDHVQPTALVIMDLQSDTIIRRHVLNDTLLRPTTTLASVTVDITGGSCADAFAYLPDLGGYGLIVYSFKENRSWRVTHNYFYLEPLAGEFSVGGHNFQWNDGIFSIALSGVDRNGHKEAYFHSMAGTHLYSVPTRVLKNHTLATRSYHSSDFKVIGDRENGSQTSASDLHPSTGILFLGLVNQNALACWNIRTPLKDVSIVQKDDRKMIYPCDVKISGNDVILLTNSMPVFLYGSLNYDEVNFRVWIEDVGKAVEGTKCAVRRGGPSY